MHTINEYLENDIKTVPYNTKSYIMHNNQHNAL